MKFLLIFLFSFFVLVSAQAQRHHLELNIRANTLWLFDEDPDRYDREWSPSLAISAEALYFPKEFIGIGLFYTRSIVDGINEYREPNMYYTPYAVDHGDYSYAHYGIAVQLTSPRDRFLRIYAVGRLGKFELVEDFGTFSFGNGGFSASGGSGIMLRLSKNVSFNLVEINYLWLPKKFSYQNDHAVGGLYAQSGISVRMFRK